MPNILVVDDDPDTLESIKTILENAGHTIKISQSAETALEMVKGEKFDLILIDVIMPEGQMQGPELFKKLRETSNHDTPLLYITIKPRAELDTSDIDGFVQKPFNNEELVSEVETTLKTFKPKKPKNEPE